MEKTKVIFKKEYNPYTKSWDVFAVFPEFKASYGKLQCFTSEGWTECSYDYYATAKKASPDEYANTLEYLGKVFDGSDGDDPLELVVIQKISTKMYDAILENWRS